MCHLNRRFAGRIDAARANDSTGSGRDVIIYYVIPNALSADEVEACLAASKRAHEPLGSGQWRQIGHLHETEPAIEALLDHPAVLPKVRALMGDYFIIQSTWCTLQPAKTKAGGYHQDG